MKHGSCRGSCHATLAKLSGAVTCPCAPVAVCFYNGRSSMSAAGVVSCHKPAVSRLAPQVLPGARVPADGEVVDGTSHVDESMITGEPAPVSKRPGDAVISGAQLLPPLPSMHVDEA